MTTNKPDIKRGSPVISAAQRQKIAEILAATVCEPGSPEALDDGVDLLLPHAAQGVPVPVIGRRKGHGGRSHLRPPD